MKAMMALLVSLILASLPQSPFYIPEVQAQYGDITYNASDRIITVTGFSESDPCSFWDVWNASNVEGWDVVLKQGLKQYWVNDTEIDIGDGSIETWFADENVQVEFYYPADSWQWAPMWVYANGHLRLGKVLDVSKRTSSNGVQMILTGEVVLTGAPMTLGGMDDLEIYSSSLIANLSNSGFGGEVWQGYSGIFRVWNTILENFDICPSDYSEADLYNLYIFDNPLSSALYLSWSPMFLQDVRLSSTYNFIYFCKNGTTIKNVYGRNSIAESLFCVVADPPNSYYLINPDFDNWTIWWQGSGSASVYRQYEFTLTVTNSSNQPIETANVTLYNNQGKVGSWLTDSNGEISTQTLTMGFYNETGGNTIYNYNPYNLTITKTGYQTYTKNFTLTEKTKWEIATLPETETPPPTEGDWTLGFAPGLFLGLLLCASLLIAGLTKKH